MVFALECACVRSECVRQAGAGAHTSGADSFDIATAHQRRGQRDEKQIAGVERFKRTHINSRSHTFRSGAHIEMERRSRRAAAFERV